MTYGALARPLVIAREIPLESDEWRVLNGYVHIPCEQVALVHPDNDRIWACRNCDLITDSPAISFKHA